MALFIFIIASVLRLALVLVNRQADDNHIEVVTRLLSRLPVDKTSCWECFQPKLYHESVAFFATLFNLRTILSLTILGELLNAVIGIASIFLIWKFIRAQKAAPWIKTLTFGLIALNPIFIGMNARATNDSYLFFFGIAALYYLIQFFTKPDKKNAILLILAVNLSLITKGSGVVVVLAVTILLLLQSIGVWAKKKPVKLYLLTLGILCITLSISTIFFSPYYTYYQKYSDPFVINWTKPPPPQWSKPTYNVLYRPGIITLADGFFTFRFFNLLMYPYTTNGYTNYPLHRTSFWSQVYGSSQSVFFAAWQIGGSFAQNQTRIVFVLALLPTLLLLTGCFLVCKRIVIALYKQKLKSLYNNADMNIFLYFFLFLLMLIYYTYVWRDYSHMKAMFIYPAILCMAAFILEGMNYYTKKLQKTHIVKIGGIVIGVLLSFYVLTIVTLIGLLLPNFFRLFS